jgi:hypothetical protein
LLLLSITNWTDPGEITPALLGSQEERTGRTHAFSWPYTKELEEAEHAALQRALEAEHVVGRDTGSLVEGEPAAVARGEDAVEDNEVVSRWCWTSG